MKKSLSIGIGFGFVGLLSSPSSAQTFTELVKEGDMLNGEIVENIQNIDVNGSGDWLVELNTDGPSTNDQYMIHNGTVIWQEGTTTGMPGVTPSGSFVDVMDINDNGDIMFSCRYTGSPSETILVRNGVLLIETGTTPATFSGLPAGTFYSNISEVWQNNNNQLLVGASVALAGTGSTAILVRMDLDAAGNIVSQTKVAMVGEMLTGPNHVTPIQGFDFSKNDYAINDNGDFMWYVDDDHTVAPGDTLSDANYYINSTLLYNEADPFPLNPGVGFDHFTTAEIDMNNSMDFVFAGFDREPSGVPDQWLYKSVGGTLTTLGHEGDPTIFDSGGFNVAGFSFGGVYMSNDGDVIWYTDTDNPDTDVDGFWMYNEQILLREGTDMLSGILVDDVPNSSDDGKFAIAEVLLTGSIDAVYLVELEGPIGMVYCDPAVANTTGMPATLEAVGSDVAADNNVTLLAAGMPTGEFGFMLNGTGNTALPMAGGTPGTLCVSDSIGRYNKLVEIFNSGPTGEGSLTLDLTDTPTPVGPTSIMAGQTWYFQCWYRDTPGVTANFTNGVEITFN